MHQREVSGALPESYYTFYCEAIQMRVNMLIFRRSQIYAQLNCFF